MSIEAEVSLIDIVEISHYVAMMEGWSDAERRSCLSDYQHFLQRASLRPTRPSVAVDRLWHEHILNTRSYEAYCMPRFGRIIHHVPCIDERLIDALSQAIGRPLSPMAGSEFARGLQSIDADLANCSGGAPPAASARSKDANCSAGNPEPPEQLVPATISDFASVLGATRLNRGTQANCGAGNPPADERTASTDGGLPTNVAFVSENPNCGAGNTPPRLASA